MIPSPPKADEVELSVFGPGVGESIVCHLGAGRWMIVDSCYRPGALSPAPLEYLRSLGLEPSECIKLIVATHWHDDHIRGLSTILESAPNAEFAVTAAFHSRDFHLAITPWLAADLKGQDRGLSEFRKIGDLQRSSRKAKEETRLLRKTASPPCSVFALSPSDEAVTACVARLMCLPANTVLQRLPNLKGNHSSIVLSVAVGARRLLLGSDLEMRSDRKFGWFGVIDRHLSTDGERHQVYKVAHHGSPNGDHSEIWEKLLGPSCYAVVTPFRNSELPSDEDCVRISSRTPNAFLTAPGKLKKFRLSCRTTEKTMQENSRGLRIVPDSFGHVRFRGAAEDPVDVWRVELDGAATAIPPNPRNG